MILPTNVVFNAYGATSNRFTYKTYGEKGIAGMVFSTGKQPLAPLEFIFFLFLWHVEHLTYWSGEGFTISVRLLHRFKRRCFCM